MSNDGKESQSIRPEIVSTGKIRNITPEIRNQLRLEFEEAKGWLSVDQTLIDEVIKIAQELPQSGPTNGTFQLPDGRTIDIIYPHGIYSEAKVVIDIWKTNSPKEEKRMAGFAFFEHSVTNHPNFFRYHPEDKFEKVTNSEIQELIELLKGIDAQN